MRNRFKTKTILIRSTDKQKNSLIVRKIHKRIKKQKPKEDLRIKRQGRTIYIDRSVR
jgi:hypothetical protein